DQSVRIERFGARRILDTLVDGGKQRHGRNADLGQLAQFTLHLIDAQSILAGHRRDLVAHSLTLDQEKRRHELIDGESRLSRHATNGATGSESSWADVHGAHTPTRLRHLVPSGVSMTSTCISSSRS